MNILCLILIAAILLSTHAAKFNIASTSVCTSTSAAGFCTKWEQNGTVQEQTVACFSGDMLVMTKNGFKSMKQLQVDDEILSYDREKGQIYTKVRGWLHRDSTTHVEFMKVTFKNGQVLKVSDQHNIAFSDKSSSFKFKFASELSLEEELYGKNTGVKSIQYVKEEGMYAPMTYNSNYFVYSQSGEESSRVLAHDFANIESPESYEPIANMMFSVYERFLGKPSGTGIHPLAKWMMKYFGFLMD